MGFLKDQHGQRKFRKDDMIDIWETLTDASAIDLAPGRTPARVKLGLAMIRFGIRLLKKIV